MGAHIVKLGLWILALGSSAEASEFPEAPPVPASLAAPDLSDSQRAAVEEAFRELREKMKQASESAPAPPPPAIPENLPSPPSFDSETQAKLEASFAPLAMQRANMGSLTPDAHDVSMSPASAHEGGASLGAPASSPAELSEGMSFLDFWPEDKKRLVAQELYLGLEKESLPADSVIGQAFRSYRERASSEDSIFGQVRNAYKAREHILNPLRLTDAAR